MIENYQFKGCSYQELIECFELGQKQNIYKFNSLEETFSKIFNPTYEEVVEKVMYVNGNKLTFTLTDREEVELEKLRQFLFKNRNDSKVVDKVLLFIIKLAEQSEDTDYNYPAFNGILEIDDSDVFMTWVIHNLELMWT